MKNLKNKKGITLVALVITIVVLLILAMITIKAFSDNGIISKAKESSAKYKLEQLKEEVAIAFQQGDLDEADDISITLENKLKEINDAYVEKVSNIEDACYVSKYGIDLTVYSNGEIIEGKVNVWDGTSIEVPTEEENSWYIYNSAQFKYFAKFVNGELTEQEKGTKTLDENTTVYLMADLDLGARENNGELISGTQWTPIGINPTNYFTGIFEGNNHTIRGVYISSSANTVGLFRVSGTIQNLSIKDSYIKTTMNVAAGISAYVNSGTIINCHNINTKVSADTKIAGGVLGQFKGTLVENYTNSGTISGETQIGGIISQMANKNSTIKNCKNTGNLITNSSYTGGIAATINEGTKVDNCENMGEITGKGYCGGIIGLVSKTSVITGSNNYGDITGETYTGGIIGSVSKNSLIRDCKNHGKIIGTKGTGRNKWME